MYFRICKIKRYLKGLYLIFWQYMVITIYLIVVLGVRECRTFARSSVFFAIQLADSIVAAILIIS